MGPPLMDAVWIYGSEPRQLFETIVPGRPNGMPAFGKKIVVDRVWQLVAYVRSPQLLSGLCVLVIVAPWIAVVLLDPCQ